MDIKGSEKPTCLDVHSHSERCKLLPAIHQSNETSSNLVPQKTVRRKENNAVTHSCIIKLGRKSVQLSDLMKNGMDSSSGVISLFVKARIPMSRQVQSNDLPVLWQTPNERQPVAFVNGDAMN